jgi:hypothetical protein
MFIRNVDLKKHLNERGLILLRISSLTHALTGVGTEIDGAETGLDRVRRLEDPKSDSPEG